MKKLLLTLAFLTAGSAFASDRIGNGGDALVCGFETEMLDTYQARADLGLTLDQEQGGLGYLAVASKFLDRLAAVNPTRANLYRGWLAKFAAEAEFKPGITLVDIPDTGAQAIPTGCHLEQIAVQREESERFPGEKRYTVSLDLWSRMNEFNKAALVLHELAYRERLGMSEKSSRLVRYFNANLISENLPNLDFRRLALVARLSSYDEAGAIVKMKFDTHEWLGRTWYSWSLYADLPVIAGGGFGIQSLEGRQCGHIYLVSEESIGDTMAMDSAQVSSCTGGPFRFSVLKAGQEFVAQISPEEQSSHTPGGSAGANGRLLSFIQLPGFFCPAGHYFYAGPDSQDPSKKWISCMEKNGSEPFSRTQVDGFRE